MNDDQGIGPDVMDAMHTMDVMDAMHTMDATHVTHASHPNAVALAAYHDGELRGAERQSVVAHVTTCAGCRRALDELSRMDGALRGLPSVEPSPRVRAAVYARVEGDASSAIGLLLNPWRPLARARWWVLAAMAAVAAAIGGYDLLAGATRPAAVGRPLSVRPSAVSRPLVSGQQVRPTRVPAAMAATSPNTVRGSGSNQSRVGPSTTTARSPIRGPLLPLLPLATGEPAPAGPAVKRFIAVPPIAVPRAAIPRTNGRLVPPRQPVRVQPLQPARVPRRHAFTVVAPLIARAGQVSLRVPAAAVQRTVDAVASLATGHGGHIARARDHGAGRVGGTGAVTLTVRVPASSFDVAMSGLRTLAGASLVGANATSRDITGRYRDLQARLAALQATRGRLMALLNHDGSAHSGTAVRDRLTVVDRRIDAVRGQILADDRIVTLSTIDVRIATIPSSRTRRRAAAPPRPRGAP